MALDIRTSSNVLHGRVQVSKIKRLPILHSYNSTYSNTLWESFIFYLFMSCSINTNQYYISCY